MLMDFRERRSGDRVRERNTGGKRETTRSHTGPGTEPKT